MRKRQVSRLKEPLVGARVPKSALGLIYRILERFPRKLFYHNRSILSRKPVFGAGSMNLYAKAIPQTGFVRGATWKETTFVQCDLFTRLMQDRHPDLFTPAKYHSLWPLGDL
ncbi:hypothetical protein I312_100829 [Cryptococcus bacillisporus CA1280]|uniref:uncharacterized protein n=1 Tax=Cryptococcus bacillisporus CA1280 TaxID=1296109 RepID=UPI0033698F4E